MGCLRTWNKPVNLLYDCRGQNPKMQDIPDVRFVELWIELLAHQCFNVEHSKGRHNVEEQDLESKPPSRAYPITSTGHTECLGGMETVRIVLSAHSKNPIFRILYQAVRHEKSADMMMEFDWTDAVWMYINSGLTWDKPLISTQAGWQSLNKGF
jgi:hypothetical protein